MATTSLYHLSVPVPPPQRLTRNNTRFCSTTTTKTLSFSNNNRGFSSRFSASSTETPPAVVEQEQETQTLSSSSSSSSDDQLSGSLTGCKACGREEIENGCNGEGRIQGGIATVPGFGWWPIKAYRPCPAFVATGGRYRRTGQSMDEVVSGNSGRVTSVGKSAAAQSSKKKEKKDRSSKADV